MEEVLVVISCFVNIILWLFMFFYFKKKFSTQEILENIRQEVDKLLIEISRETDRDLSLIEDKMKALSELIETADKHIKLAKKEQKKQKKEEDVLQKIQAINNPQPVEYEQSVYPVRGAVSHYIENSSSASDNVVVKPAPEMIKNEKTKKDRILDLWKLGMAPEMISEKLTVSLTEIRMVIDMYG